MDIELGTWGFHTRTSPIRRIDIYRGRVAMKIQTSTVVRGLHTMDEAWHWCVLPDNVVSVALDCQPNRHVQITPLPFALDGRWRHMKDLSLEDRYLRKLGVRIGSEILETSDVYHSLSVIRYGRVATVATPIELKQPPAWVCASNYDDLIPKDAVEFAV